MRATRIPTRMPNDTVCHSVAYLDHLQRMHDELMPHAWAEHILNRYVRPLVERYFGDERNVGYRVTAEPVDYGEAGLAVVFCIRPNVDDPRWKGEVS